MVRTQATKNIFYYPHFVALFVFIVTLFCSASVTAMPLTATFDGFSEGDTFFELNDGGITFSDLDERLPEGQPPAQFTIESSTESILGASFSAPNYLTTEGYSPGDDASFGRFGSVLISPNIRGVAASIDIFGFGGSPNILTLEALLSGLVVTSESMSFGSIPGIASWSLVVSDIKFR